MGLLVVWSYWLSCCDFAEDCWAFFVAGGVFTFTVCAFWFFFRRFSAFVGLIGTGAFYTPRGKPAM
jgi:hypothetical protein